MSWDERVEGASEDLDPLARQQKGRLAREKQGGESKWKEEKEEKTRIELHPVSCSSVCLCLTSPSSPSLSVKVNTADASVTQIGRKSKEDK